MRSKHQLIMLVAGLVVALAFTSVGVASAATNTWQAAYWANPDLAGTPSLYRAESEISHEWGLASPAVGFQADNFSARWVRYVNLSAKTYRFFLTSDDGA